MEVFYKHEGQELINSNNLLRRQIEEINDISEIYDLIDQIKLNNMKGYIEILKLLAKDAYVYLNLANTINDLPAIDKIFFNSYQSITKENYEDFILENDEKITEYGINFIYENPLFQTRAFLELSEIQNDKIIELYPAHLLDIEDYVEDLNVSLIINYYNHLKKDDEFDLLNNQTIIEDIVNFLNYLYNKNIYLFEKLISEIKNKIYKWNKYLLDNENLEDEEFIRLLEEKDPLELGEIALENTNIMVEMLYQLLEYEEEKQEVITDEFGNSIIVTENEVDEYMKKLEKRK